MSVSLQMKSVSWRIVIVAISFHTAFCFRNFALNRLANQSSTLLYKFEWTADKAVDGNTSGSNPDRSRTCSATNATYGNHTWEVDIGFQVIVKNITVYGRTDQGDLIIPVDHLLRPNKDWVYAEGDEHQIDGFLLYIGNKSSSWIYNQPIENTSSRLYQHSFQPKDSVARFISVVRRNQWILTICEVQVIGECLDGVYSEFCNKTCGHCYTGLPCNKETGSCLKGCDLGWKGEICDTECDNGTYGVACNETCGNCLSGSVSCSKLNGQCTDGCQAGWQGATCTKECDNGTYGIACNKTCGNCLSGNNSCSKIDGKCTSGCQAGWQGATCTQECDNGTYGVACNETCGNCLSGSVSCSKLNGQCTDGCQAGWQGATCTKECDNGTYGIACNKTCGNCLSGNNSCSKIDGKCTSGCQAGWQGATCTQECDNGTYGVACNETCGNCLSGSVSCSKLNGQCTDGCQAGWQGATCTKECDNGTYGIACNKTCGNCLSGNNSCSKIDGKCTSGCQAGWQGATCTQECDNGTYGVACNETCGNCLSGSVSCSKLNGQCTDGCQAGWQGATCTKECDNGTYGIACNKTCGNCLSGNNSCSKIDGKCTSGCQAGWQGATCTQECDNGTYGVACNETCGNCLSGSVSCSKLNGQCTDGCQAGWQGATCTKECDNGTYGIACNKTCGNCLSGNNSCSKIDGKCTSGCQAGWQGATCTQECDNGTYGIACNKTCGNCLSGSVSCSKLNGQCTDGCQAGWQGATCTQEKSNTPESNSHGNPIVIIVVVSVVLVTLIAIAVLVVIIKCRIRRKHKKEDVLDKTENDETILVTVSEGKHSNDSQLAEDVDLEETSVLSQGAYHNTEKQKQLMAQRIPVLKFWDHVMSKKANKAELESEFHELTEGLSKKHDMALANPSKNRYKFMYPYDFNRVVLKRDLTQSTENRIESDYTNASHIKGYEGRKNYIACQGPTDKTICDFWWMIWQEETECIVMLTSLVEMGKVKCKQYWPEEGEEDYEGVRVKLVRVEAGPDYVKRHLDITVGDKSRRVAQFHYKAWPDKDVPDTAWSLVGFWKDVRKSKIYGEGPMVVHCSAGVGRTGTFIALDIIYNEVCETGHVAVMRCVDNLREQRVNMVQTANQYMFLHEVVAEALGFGTMPVFEKQFSEVFRHLMEKDEHSGITFLERQYNMISNVDRGNDEGDAQVYSNISSFQSENIRLPNLSGKDAYIVVKWTGDLLSMVNKRQCNVKTVINVDSETPYDAWFLLEINGSKTVSGITITCKGKEELDAFEKKQFTITNKEKTESSYMTVFMIKSWQKSDDVPADTSSILALLENIDQWHPSPTESNPILIYSRFAMNRCGVIYTLLIEKDRIRRDGEIHIMRTSVDIFSRSRTLLPTFDQYVFLHKCLLSHATQEFTYENTAALNKIK